MKKLIPSYENYCIYDNGDIVNITNGKILKGSIGVQYQKFVEELINLMAVSIFGIQNKTSTTILKQLSRNNK